MRRTTLLALAIAIGLAAAVSPFASGAPDGLERVAADQGFGARERAAAVHRHAPAPGYAIPGVRDERVAKGLAGLAGSLAVFAFAAGVAGAARRRPRGRTA
jgi:hypothetical protein